MDRPLFAADSPGFHNQDKDVMTMEQPRTALPARGAFVPPPEKPRHFALSRTTDRVLQILLRGDLSRLRADSVAEELGMSGTTLRRRLRADHTSYQFLLDRARQYRCEQRLRQAWLPGKCLADELGYLEVNSFYRAFRRWTGLSYSEYKLRYC
jgi:AraC family mar-sox-rob regulon transcriptional activator